MDLFAADFPDDVGDRTVPEPGRTPPPARAPRTRDHIDLDDWEPPESRAGSRRWLLVAALVPWVVVVAVMVVGGRKAAPARPETTTPAAAPSEAPHAAASRVPTPVPTAGPTTAPSPSSSVRGDTVVALAGPSGPTSRGRAEGVAIGVARTWLSTRPAGPPVAGLEPSPGAGARYVEHLAIESVDHPARGAVVVTLRAIVLPVEDDAYGRAQQLRLAVPVAVDADDATPAGTPWLLPVDPLEVEQPSGAPVEDPDLMLAAAEAVTTAGYRDVSLTSLERTPGWAWLAVVDAHAPGEDDAREHTVWLRADVGRLVVAGTAARPDVPPPTAETPSPPPSDPEAEATP